SLSRSMMERRAADLGVSVEDLPVEELRKIASDTRVNIGLTPAQEEAKAGKGFDAAMETPTPLPPEKFVGFLEGPNGESITVKDYAANPGGEFFPKGNISTFFANRAKLLLRTMSPDDVKATITGEISGIPYKKTRRIWDFKSAFPGGAPLWQDEATPTPEDFAATAMSRAMGGRGKAPAPPEGAGPGTSQPAPSGKGKWGSLPEERKKLFTDGEIKNAPVGTQAVVTYSDASGNEQTAIFEKTATTWKRVE
ncbi:MAG: hypothetical protein KKH61_20975, partial [Gammaproteobacteria bacterium]|nr:hypothetical protein [Gammaproteobacteria bacterium]